MSKYGDRHMRVQNEEFKVYHKFDSGKQLVELEDIKQMLSMESFESITWWGNENWFRIDYYTIWLSVRLSPEAIEYVKQSGKLTRVDK